MSRFRLSTFLAVLVLAAGLSACTNTQNYEAQLNYWLGRSEQDLLMAWGVPDKQYQMDAQRKMISYVKRDIAVNQSASFSTCVGTFGNPMFGGCSGIPTSVSTYSCETTFIITRGRVERWGHEGNDCRS